MQQKTKSQEAYMQNKILIAYFSQTSNTRRVAQTIHETTGGTLFEIQTEDPYPAAFGLLYERSKKERMADYKPPLKTHIANISEYDIIFIGGPVWWNTVTPPVSAFLSENNFEGKIIIPFITYAGCGGGGGRIRQCARAVKKLCPRTIVLNTLASYGTNLGDIEQFDAPNILTQRRDDRIKREVSAWLCKLKIAHDD
jgi:flavodoxin